jgi:hypothetical protein
MPTKMVVLMGNDVAWKMEMEKVRAIFRHQRLFTNVLVLPIHQLSFIVQVIRDFYFALGILMDFYLKFQLVLEGQVF